jgi:hypothetical protein
MAIPRNLANIAPHVNASSTELVVNDAGANLDFRVEGDTNANLIFADASADAVGIGTSSPAGRLSVLRNAGGGGLAGVINNPQFAISNEENYGYQTGMLFRAPLTNGSGALNNAAIWAEYQAENNAYLGFATYGGGALTERVRIASGGEVAIGGVINAASFNNFNLNTNPGVSLKGDGVSQFARSSGTVILANRQTDDGTIISLIGQGVEEGTISVSGNTVSYNAFCGGHWTQLQEGRGYNPEIPRGTVMSSIGEMAVWKSVEWTETIEHPAVEAVEAKEAVLDEEGNVIEPAVEAVEGKEAWTETFNKRESYLGNLDIGETFEEDGFTKTVVDDGNERLPKVKISDVVGDKAVYGVFQTWDDVEDMLITSLGAFVVRIAAGVTVQIGDLLESNGDGCAKVQDDDIIRSKTIGKVTSTVATATYDDGSYTVPCVIYCG